MKAIPSVGAHRSTDHRSKDYPATFSSRRAYRKAQIRIEGGWTECPTAFGALMSRVRKSVDHCWLWTGAGSATGYGVLAYRGKKWLAHRLSWTLHVGPIPEGLLVCHHCDTPACVRPNHLFLGTNTDNLRDASAKGRMHPGARHGMAKLTGDQVQHVRGLSALGVRGTDIAALVNVHPNTIYHILKGRTWRRG